MNQERKAAIAPVVKAILKRYGLKGSLSVHNHSTLCLTIKEGPIDFIGNCNETCGNDHYQVSRGFQKIQSNYMDVNTYWIHDHFSGVAKQCLQELKDAMNVGNHDRSDIQTDYFDVGWYIDINVGRWNKPYILNA